WAIWYKSPNVKTEFPYLANNWQVDSRNDKYRPYGSRNLIMHTNADDGLLKVGAVLATFLYMEN
ncbi:hypothetical protein, partial [Neisseria sp. P0017.S003]|uniref:hypothetical protein n=1 Tax=Neisseria sp. P0017.S003 TaxID=3436779 RepID=UPI003F80DE08